MNENKNYVIGLDGGGTKTHCALYDINGNQKDFMEFGATNHETLPDGFMGVKTELYKILNTIFEKNGVGVQQLKFCVFGMAGVDTREQHEIISNIIRDFGIVDFILCNDSYLGIKAGCTNSIGICAINGTGFSVTGIDKAGAMLQLGGLGNMTSDKGGGSYLFERVISSVYNHLYKGAQNTCMKEMMFFDLGITNKADFLEKMTERIQISGKEYVLTINQMIYDAANNNDPVALDILEEVGTEYAKAIGGIFHELDFDKKDKVEVILAGSQFTKGANKASIIKLETIIKAEFIDYEIEFKILEVPCVIGAVLWALEKANQTVNLREKVSKEFTERTPK